MSTTASLPFFVREIEVRPNIRLHSPFPLPFQCGGGLSYLLLMPTVTILNFFSPVEPKFIQTRFYSNRDRYVLNCWTMLTSPDALILYGILCYQCLNVTDLFRVSEDIFIEDDSPKNLRKGIKRNLKTVILVR